MSGPYKPTSRETFLMRLTICGKCDRSTVLRKYENEDVTIESRCRCVSPAHLTEQEWRLYKKGHK